MAEKHEHYHPKEDVHHSVKEAVEKHEHEHFPSHEKHAPHQPGDHSPQVISTHEAEHNEEFHTTPKGLRPGFVSGAEKRVELNKEENTGLKATAHENTKHHGGEAHPNKGVVDLLHAKGAGS